MKCLSFPELALYDMIYWLQIDFHDMYGIVNFIQINVQPIFFQAISHISVEPKTCPLGGFEIARKTT